MSTTNHDEFDEDASRRTQGGPYTASHPLPTIAGYQKRKEERQEVSNATAPQRLEEEASQEDSRQGGLLNLAKGHLHLGGSTKNDTADVRTPYKSQNRNTEPPSREQSEASNDYREDGRGDEGAGLDRESNGSDGNGSYGSKEHSAGFQDTSEAFDGSANPKKKRKNMKSMKRDNRAREVTDPVTHLRVMVHDSTQKELRDIPENEPPARSLSRSATGASAVSKRDAHLNEEGSDQQMAHTGMEKLFPPPEFDMMKAEIGRVYTLALTVGLSTMLLAMPIFLFGFHFIGPGIQNQPYMSGYSLSLLALLTIGLAFGGCILWSLKGWLNNRIKSICEDEIWRADRELEQENSNLPIPESTQWLNSILSSVWPLINPDLFISLADTVEDVMQASLPRMIRMVSVEDLGQGSEALRILGVRWLPTGAAAKNVSEDGKIKNRTGQDQSDRKVPGQGQLDADEKPNDRSDEPPDEQNQRPEKPEEQENGDEQNVAEGLEAEEGDFVNAEIGFSYRASSSGKSLKRKSKNAHLFLGFYLPGGLKVPVWVELRGIVGTARLRLQLSPDPPFFSLCTLTFLGQPKAELSCAPLTKKGLNIMDVPLISSFVQSSIDAALAEYVAPRSLTLDLKDMLVGDDFKKDTSTHGIIMVTIGRGINFRAGDPGLGAIKKASSDAYVAVGWAKFGKPVWSTRVIVQDMQPVWEETAFILVGTQELNAQERLRVQLWDSDRTSADDDLGRIEVDLKEIMHDSRSKGRIWSRTDSFQALGGDDQMPGTLEWSVGYYAKVRIQDEQLEKQKVEPGVQTVQELKDRVSTDAERKICEAQNRNESTEMDQQKAQMLKDEEDAMIASTPSLHRYPSGIFSVQIHQITGLQFERINKNQAESDEGDNTETGSGDLPSAYCTVILNHQTIFKTRTKPKSAQPFFNAGTERLIRDWRTAEVMIAVRDSRVHENNPLLGLVYLPLGKLLKEHSQFMDSYPLVGGIGYGRVRISIVFRSIELQLPRQLLGWDYGTVDIKGPITSKDLATDLSALRLKVRTSVNRGKMYHSKTKSDGDQWTGKRDRPVRIGVRKRYCSCLVVEFRRNQLGLDKTPAFAILWLKDIPDDDDCTVTLSVWRGNSDNLKRAESNCITEDLGERAGSIEVPLRFYRGLGVYHHSLVSHSPNLQDVFEVLSTANDCQEVRTEMAGEDGSLDGDSSSSSEDEAKGPKQSVNGLIKKFVSGKDDDSDDGDNAEEKAKSDGPLEQIKGLTGSSKQSQRRHRGLMQWRVARTGKYLKTKMEHGKDHLVGSVKHQGREPGIETEV